MNCIICFEDLKDTEEDGETNYIECLNKCKNYVCIPCFTSFLDISLKDKTEQKCPECNSCYGYSDVKNKINIEKFVNLTIDNFTKTNTEVYDSVKNRLSLEKVLEKVRAERIEFVNKNMPKAIALVTRISLSKKLRTINKQNEKSFKEKITSNKRKCIVYACSGKLEPSEDKLTCTLCELKFCKHCEKILKSGHVCNQNEVESISAVNSMIKCPTCEFPVIKADGCNIIHCASCNSVFNYSSGKLLDEPIHAANKHLNLKSSHNLYDYYKDSYSKEIINTLFNFEMNIPILPSNEKLENILLKIEESKDPKKLKELKIKFVKEYEEYMILRMAHKKYLNKITNIELLHEKKELTLEKLNEIINGI